MALEINAKNIIIISSILVFVAVSGYLIFSYFNQQTGTEISQLGEVDVERPETAEDSESDLSAPAFLGVSQTAPDSSGITQTPPSTLGATDDSNKGGETISNGITQTKP